MFSSKRNNSHKATQQQASGSHTNSIHDLMHKRYNHNTTILLLPFIFHYMYTATEAQGNDISYAELAKRVWDCILANTARQQIEDAEDFAWTLYDEENDEYIDSYQSYIITQSGAEYLQRNTSEVVVYSEKFDLYFWEITHYGTAWTHVFTSIKNQ